MTDIYDKVKEKSTSAKIYEAKIKTDTEFYAKEKKRVAEYMKERHKTDVEYRARIKEQKKASYNRIKEAKMFASIPVSYFFLLSFKNKMI